MNPMTGIKLPVLIIHVVPIQTLRSVGKNRSKTMRIQQCNILVDFAIFFFVLVPFLMKTPGGIA